MSQQANLSYAGLGKQDGQAVRELAEKTGSYAKNCLVQRANEFANNTETIKDYLSGFGETAGKTQKSEARAVFEAFAKDSAKVMDSVKILGYSEFIKACRQIRGKKGGGKKGDKLTDKQQADIVEKIKLMGHEQAIQVCELAFVQLQQTVENWEHPLMVLAESISTMLADSTEPIYQNMASKLDSTIQEYWSHVEAEKAKQQAADPITAEIKGLLSQVISPEIQAPMPLAA